MTSAPPWVTSTNPTNLTDLSLDPDQVPIHTSLLRQAGTLQQLRQRFPLHLRSHAGSKIIERAVSVELFGIPVCQCGRDLLYGPPLTLNTLPGSRAPWVYWQTIIFSSSNPMLRDSSSTAACMHATTSSRYAQPTEALPYTPQYPCTPALTELGSNGMLGPSAGSAWPPGPHLVLP